MVKQLVTELWIDSEYLKEIWQSLDEDKVTIRAEFDLETREKIKALFKEIALLKAKDSDET